MKLKAIGNILEILTYQRITSESLGIYDVHFEFDHTWDGFMPTAVFKTHSVTRAAVLDADNSCKIPGEVLVNPGPLSIAVFGVNAAGSIITTNYVTHGMIIKGADITAVGQESTPGMYEQLLAKISGIEMLISQWSY